MEKEMNGGEKIEVDGGIGEVWGNGVRLWALWGWFWAASGRVWDGWGTFGDVLGH